MAKHAQPEPRRISLANKCLLLFGCAIVLILIVALSVPWFRTYVLVREYQLEVASQVANAWLEARLPGQDVQSTPKRPASGSSGLRVTFDWIEDIDTTRNQSFIARALTAFRNDPTIQHFAIPVQDGDTEVYLYARPIKASMLRSLRISSVTDFTAGAVEPSVADELKAILVVRRTTQFGESQLQLSRTYIIITGLVAGLLAVIVFYFILTKLIFSPVRRLRAKRRGSPDARRPAPDGPLGRPRRQAAVGGQCETFPRAVPKWCNTIACMRRGRGGSDRLPPP